MAYDRFDARRDGRDSRPRERNEERDFGRDFGRDRGSDERFSTNDRDERGFSARGSDERGWFERAGDEIASWFGDDEAERRRRHEQPDRFSGSGRSHLRNEEDVQHFYGSRSH